VDYINRILKIFIDAEKRFLKLKSPFIGKKFSAFFVIFKKLFNMNVLCKKKFIKNNFTF